MHALLRLWFSIVGCILGNSFRITVLLDAVNGHHTLVVESYGFLCDGGGCGYGGFHCCCFAVMTILISFKPTQHV